MEYNPSFVDQLDVDYICHYGIKGMHWGVRRYQNPDGSYTALGAANRKKLSKIDRKYDKLAKKDAKEYARAKMSYGEGAGNRRKLIKSKVEQRRKENEHYNKVFDEYLAQEDMSKHADAAKRERTAKDAAKTTKRAAKTAVKVFNTVAPLLHDDETDAYLEHHGIKGQKWGIRRYQNEDGTLTPAGEERYLKKLNKANKNEMVSDYFSRKHAENVDQLSEFKRLDPKNYKKQVPKGLLEHEKSKMNEWTRRNKKDVENVKKWMNKMNLDKKHLVYDIMTNQYYIAED